MTVSSIVVKESLDEMLTRLVAAKGRIPDECYSAMCSIVVNFLDEFRVILKRINDSTIPNA